MIRDLLLLFFEGRLFGLKNELAEYGADIHGVRQLIIYGLKGMSTYARHARFLGEWDDSIGAFTHEVRQWRTGLCASVPWHGDP